MILAAALLGLCCEVGFSADYLPVQYLSRVKKGVLESFRDVTAQGTPVQAQDTDDTPLTRVPLPTGFPFFGRMQYAVHVSGNGGLHFDTYPPCACCFVTASSGGQSSCDFNTSYANMLAVFVADFIPAAEKNATITYAVIPSPDRLAVRFADIPLFGVLDSRGPRYTFGAILHLDSGRISFIYEDVVMPELVHTRYDIGVPQHVASTASVVVGVKPSRPLVRP